MPQVKGDRRDKHGHARLAEEAATAGREDLMEAMVAACAYVAHADGSVDPMERRRVVQLMRALPAFAGFSTEAVGKEFARHEQAFEEEPSIARDKVLQAITALTPYASEARVLLLACQKVLEADGIHHPKEYQALHDIGKALRAA